MDDLIHLFNPDKWKSLQTIITIESERYNRSSKKIQKAIRYYISSLPKEPEILGRQYDYIGK